jgi:hypothetical protein
MARKAIGEIRVLEECMVFSEITGLCRFLDLRDDP